tara:strand:- start:6550 stop:7056 length:507 start_codon:yes stop_codon:yes gene_type:complete
MAITKVSRGLINSAGKVLQVVTTTKTDTWSGSSGSWVDITNFNVSITPASASNKVLIQLDINGSNSNLASFRLVRNITFDTVIARGDDGGGVRQRVTIGPISFPRDGNRSFNAGMNFLDTPSTTSATTYKLQAFAYIGTNYINRTNENTNANYTGMSVSTITAMEIEG